LNWLRMGGSQRASSPAARPSPAASAAPRPPRP
jgi:hypothetical protein